MSRETENTLLLLVGLSTAIIAATGSFMRFVKPALLPWLWITAVVLIALALTAIIGDIRRGPRRHGDHGHRTGISWLLIVPIALLAFVVPPALSPQSARPAVSDTSQTTPRRPFPPLPAADAPELSLPALLIRIAQDSTETLRDREITVTGFTMRDGERTYLGRIVILCCAADAQLARAALTGPAARAAADLPDGSWVRVRGEVKDLFQHVAVPELSIDDVQSVAQPENTYAF
ncbi:TIGR03943 family putative permease subunit [Mycolicibacterium sp. A43C]